MTFKLHTVKLNTFLNLKAAFKEHRPSCSPIIQESGGRRCPCFSLSEISPAVTIVLDDGASWRFRGGY